ncbi:PIG-L deacetylase family protein [Leucobacter sp. GX24907]
MSSNHVNEPSETPRVIAGVWAHPDDELYLTATLMLRTIGAGGRVRVIHATLGEVGAPYPEIDREAVAELRDRELTAAMGVLGVHDLQLLGFSDGECHTVSDSDGVAAVRAALADLSPDLVVTFGPEGITGHPDHIAVSRWTTAAWLDLERRGGLPAGAQLLYATMTDGFVARHHLEYPPEFPLTLRGEPITCPDDALAMHLHPTPEEAKIKREALAAHASQVVGPVTILGEDRFFEWWTSEMFREPTAAELAAASTRHGES